MRSFFVLVFILTVPLANSTAKESKIIIQNMKDRLCVVEDKETLFQGVVVAKESLESQRFIETDLITFIRSEDSDTDCKFWFVLSHNGQKTTIAEITLAKKEWRIKHRKMVQGNDSVSW